MKRLIYILITLTVTALSAPARDTSTGIFRDDVRTLRVTFADNIFAPPMVVLGAGEWLDISFDQLAEDRSYLRYRAVRCDADWQPSSIAESEWLDGFNESAIEDYAFSRATTVHYVNYHFTFPNEDISPTLSGNYLLEVYSEDNPDEVWLQVRTMLSEQVADVAVEITSRTDIDYNDQHQQLSISVGTERAHVANPFNDLKIVVQQNGRTDNEVTLTYPLRLSGHTAIFEHSDPLIFEAGNEYRRMEIISTQFPSIGVDRIEYLHPYYHFTLFTDEARFGRSYAYDSTQHGRFFIREYNSADSDTEADYAVVHFILDQPELSGWTIYLDGDFTCRRFDQGAVVPFNPATGRYEKAVLLKQGAYNYQYLAVPSGSTLGTPRIIEGNKYQTTNEYLIKVYTRGPVDRTDRLISVALASTAN